MAGKSNSGIDFDRWAEETGVTREEVGTAWRELRRRGLVWAKHGKATASPLAMRRSTTDAERRLASHLSGYELTENSFIVRRIRASFSFRSRRSAAAYDVGKFVTGSSTS